MAKLRFSFTKDEKISFDKAISRARDMLRARENVIKMEGKNINTDKDYQELEDAMASIKSLKGNTEYDGNKLQKLSMPYIS